MIGQTNFLDLCGYGCGRHAFDRLWLLLFFICILPALNRIFLVPFVQLLIEIGIASTIGGELAALDGIEIVRLGVAVLVLENVGPVARLAI